MLRDVVLSQICWELAMVFLHCGELCSTDATPARHAIPCSPTTSGKKQLSRWWYQHSCCLVGWTMSCCNTMKGWRSGKYYLFCTDEQGARFWEICNAYPIWENRAVYMENIACNSGKFLSLCSVFSIFASDQMKHNLSGFLGWTLNRQGVRKISWGEIKASG